MHQGIFRPNYIFKNDASLLDFRAQPSYVGCPSSISILNLLQVLSKLSAKLLFSALPQKENHCPR